MKKLFALALAAVMAIAMTACGSKEAAYANRLEEIKGRGYITVATEPYFAPQEFIDPTAPDDDNIVGCDIEFAKWLADKMGVELRIVPLEFTEVLASVQEGKYDLAISALGYKEERAESMNLSKPYYKSGDSKGYGFVVRAEDADKYPTAESYEGATLIVQKASMQEEFILKQIPGATTDNLKYLSSMNDTFYAVSEGKADAAACAIDMAELFIQQNPSLGLAIAKDFKFYINPDTEGTIIAMKKGEDELTAEINKLVEEFVQTGLYKEWNDYYKDYAQKLGIE